MSDASVLADRIEKAHVVSVLEQYEKPGPVWAMPLNDEDVTLIVQSLRGHVGSPKHQEGS